MKHENCQNEIAVLRHMYPSLIVLLIPQKYIDEFIKEFKKLFKKKGEQRGTLTEIEHIDIYGQFLLKFPPSADDTVQYKFEPVKREVLFYNLVQEFCTRRNLKFFVPKTYSTE